MANAIWPAALPQDVLTQGYEEKLANNLIRSQTDQGPAKVRRFQSAGVRAFHAATMMDRTQLVAFRDFVKAALEDGALPFDWVDPSSDQTPLPIATFRFVIPPEPTIRPQPGAKEWMVEFDLEILP